MLCVYITLSIVLSTFLSKKRAMHRRGLTEGAWQWVGLIFGPEPYLTRFNRYWAILKQNQSVTDIDRPNRVKLLVYL